MAGEDREVKEQLHRLLVRTIGEPRALRTLVNLEDVMHGQNADELVRLMQKWLAAL